MPRPDRRALLLALVTAWLVVALAPALAQDSAQKKLQDVEKKIEESRQAQEELSRQADTLASELQSLRDGEIKAAGAAQAHEAALDRLETRLGSLEAQEKIKARELDQKRAAEERLLTALTRLARDPPEALALGPSPAVDNLRGGLLLGRALPPLEARARTLHDQIAALENLRAQIAQTEAQHRAEKDGLAQEQTRLAALIARKRDLQQKAQAGAEAGAKRQAELAAKASDLRDLIARLETARLEAERRERAAAARAALRPAPKAGETLAVVALPIQPDPTRPKQIRPMSQAKGRMAVPASGIVVARFGDTDGAGTSKGLLFETRPGAQVVAPFDGKVLYAGAFKGYGQILIIGHGDGYHSLLAGLDRVESSVGQWLVAGEPVGVMSQGSQKPRLYLELRLNGQPINPLPWLALRDEKVNG